jgi:hypothetical protein
MRSSFQIEGAAILKAWEPMAVVAEGWTDRKLKNGKNSK